MQIAGYIKTSLIEWPGKIASVIFTPGCNFRCPFCHNRDLADPRRIKKLPKFDEREILAEIKKRKKWLDGIVVSGGEPSCQPDLDKFLKKCKKMGYLTMVETNGTNPKVINGLIINKLTDYIAMDVKGNFDNYQNFTNVKCPLQGKQMSHVKSSIELIIKSGVEYEFKTTVVPGLHDIKNLISLAEQLKSMVYSPKWFLQQFRPMNTLDPKFLKIKPYSKEELEVMQKELQKIIPQTYLRGV